MTADAAGQADRPPGAGNESHGHLGEPDDRVGPRDHPAIRHLNLGRLGWPGRPSPLATKTLLFIGEGSATQAGGGRLSPGMPIEISTNYGEPWFRAYDKVGNEEAVGSQLVRIDDSPPSAPALTVTESPASPNQHVSGTTLFYNPQGGKTIESAGFSGSIVIGNNLTSGNAMHDQGQTPPGMLLVDNLLNTNPLLVNPPIDFHLQAGSPAVNAGELLASVVIDFEGTSRPQGPTHDIGADER